MDLRKGDCLKILPEIEEKSIDLFLLDLPYGQTACKWDSIIDLKEMWVQIKRTMKPNAVILFFCTTKFGYKLIQSNEKWFRYDLIWEKSRKVGFLSANKMPLRKHENIYVFKDKGGTYNPQKTTGHKTRIRSHNKNADIDHCVYGDKLKIKPEDTTEERHPTSVLPKDLGMIEGGYYRGENGKPFKRMPNDPTSNHPTSILPDFETTILKHNNPSKSLHKTQKPVSLCEWLVKTYSNEGDLVCDFCMGSGTVGVACKNTNRKFLGIEMDDEIFDVAKNRIESHN